MHGSSFVAIMGNAKPGRSLGKRKAMSKVSPASSTLPTAGQAAFRMELPLLSDSVQMKSETWGQMGDRTRHCHSMKRIT